MNGVRVGGSGGGLNDFQRDFCRCATSVFSVKVLTEPPHNQSFGHVGHAFPHAEKMSADKEEVAIYAWSYGSLK